MVHFALAEAGGCRLPGTRRISNPCLCGGRLPNPVRKRATAWRRRLVAELPQEPCRHSLGRTTRPGTCALTKAVSTLVTALYEDIAVGVYPFGQKLVEERIAESYSAKRHALREAFIQLEEIGLVERIPNRGVFVREPGPREVRETFEIRALLELHASSNTRLPVPASITRELRRVQARHTGAIRRGDFRAVLHENTAFHRIQYSACPNATLVAAIVEYATRTHPITAMKFVDSDRMERVIEQHHRIILALEGNDHGALVEAVREHFDLQSVDRYEQQFWIRHPSRSPGERNAHRTFGT